MKTNKSDYRVDCSVWFYHVGIPSLPPAIAHESIFLKDFNLPINPQLKDLAKFTLSFYNLLSDYVILDFAKNVHIKEMLLEEADSKYQNSTKEIRKFFLRNLLEVETNNYPTEMELNIKLIFQKINFENISDARELWGFTGVGEKVYPPYDKLNPAKWLTGKSPFLRAVAKKFAENNLLDS